MGVVVPRTTVCSLTDIDRQTDRQADRQTDRQAGRQAACFTKA